MVPRTILNQLSRLRWRERVLRLTWSMALWVAIAAAALSAACFVDWLVDRWQDTPFQLRETLAFAQVVLWGAALVLFLTWTFWKGMRDEQLALRVEDQVKEFDHRLITALQLNRAGAKTEGMSPALIAAATRQAEVKAAAMDFASLADHRHLKRTGLLLLPLAVAGFLVAALWSDTLVALLLRQLLLDRDIPRSVALENDTRDVWPSGEEVVVRFKANGPGVASAKSGTVRIYPQGRSSEDYPLARLTETINGEATFIARVPPSSADFTFRAWLADGRTRKESAIRYEPRPAITKQDAWALVPKYCGLKPDGTQYDQYQPRGDIFGLPGTSARVVIETQKPIQEATLEVLGPPVGEALAHLTLSFLDPPGVPLAGLLCWLPQSSLALAPQALSDQPLQFSAPEVVIRKINLKVNEDRRGAEGRFDLLPGETSYRIQVKDDFGFVNLDPPRRRVQIVAEDAPIVELLPERFPGSKTLVLSEEDEVAGVPVLVGSQIRVGYSTRHPYGLGKAWMVYRVNEGEWVRLPLRDVPGSADKGPFDLRRGLFQASLPEDKIEFHAVPSPEPRLFLGRIAGGGNWDFQTEGIAKEGDRVEYYIEVFNRNPAMADQPGRSEVRLKTVVDDKQFLAWMTQTLQQENRLRQIESRQRGIFSKPVTVEDDLPPPRQPKTDPPQVVAPPVRPARTTTFVKEWQLVGPFANEDDRGRDTAYPPETDKTDLAREFDGIKGKVRWKLHQGRDDVINLNRIFDTKDAGVAYGICWVQSDTGRMAILATGSADGIKVWLNRRKVLDKPGPRAVRSNDDKTLIELDKGWNELLVKVDNRAGPWAFTLEVRHPETGNPLDGIDLSTSPPAEDPKKFVRSWQLIGPFPNVDLKGRDIAYPPETEKINLVRAYDGIGGAVRWQLHQSQTGKIDLEKFFGRPFQEQNVAYAVCWVRSPDEKNAVLATGSDDGIKVWLNRKLRIDVSAQREALPGKDLQQVRLSRGWNEVLVKVDNRIGHWAFYLELRDPDTGGPLQGLEFTTRPPE